MIHTVVVYQEEADEDELWIGCNVCDKWYCGYCENFSLPPDVDIYLHMYSMSTVILTACPPSEEEAP